MAHTSGSSPDTAANLHGPSTASQTIGLYLSSVLSGLANMTSTTTPAAVVSHNNMLSHENTAHGYLPYANDTVVAASGDSGAHHAHAGGAHETAGIDTTHHTEHIGDEHGEHAEHFAAVETTTMRDLSDALATLQAGGKLPTIRLSNESVLYGILIVMLAQTFVIMLIDAYVTLFYVTRASRQRHWYHHTSVRQMLLGLAITALSAVVASVFDVCRIVALADDDVTLCAVAAATLHNATSNNSTHYTTISPEVAAAACGASAPPSTFPSWLFRVLFYILRCFQLALFTLIPWCAFHKYQLFEYTAYGRHSDRGEKVMQALRGGTAQPTTYDNERVFSRRNLAMKQFFPALYAIVVGVLIAVIIQIERGAVGVTGEMDNLWPFVTTTPYIWVPESNITGDGPRLQASWYLYTLLFYVVPLVIAVVVDRLLFSHQVYAEIRLHEMVTAPPTTIAEAGKSAPAPKKGERPEDKLREHIFDASSVRRQHAAAFFLAWIVPVVHDTVNHFQHADQKLDVLANVEWGWDYELPSLVLLCISQYMFLCFAIFSLQFVHGLPVDVSSQGTLATVKKTQ